MKIIANLDLSEATTVNQINNYFDWEGEQAFTDKNEAIDYIVEQLDEGTITFDDVVEVFDAVIEWTTDE